jgi:PAS domain-containing protein
MIGSLNAINGILLLLLTLAIVQIYRLRRKSQRYQALLDGIPDLAWVKDNRSRFVIIRISVIQIS